MRIELDELLCKKYPKIFVNRNAPMTETAMCWGFDCGDGWYNIIDQFCRQAQWRIDQSAENRQRYIKYNYALKIAVDGDTSKLYEYYSGFNDDFRKECIERDIKEPQYHDVPDEVHQVVAAQVKEKYGTLRFYYDGGDRFIDGLECMAESMSAVTCEVCGNTGKTVTGGWIRTLCKTHAEEQNYNWNDDETPTED